MSTDVDEPLIRWTNAGLIDEETAARIRRFERDHAGSGRLRWPILVALAFGALMVATGVLLFVSAHWDTLSPHVRFTLVLMLVAVFHVAAAAAAERFPAMSSTMHAIGTVTLGAGILLAGQIFNLDEHWPGGLMLWALGAAVAALLLGQAPQIALVATLGPAWLASEWFVAAGERRAVDSDRVVVCGIFLLALSYFTSSTAETTDARRRALLWLGGIWLLPAAALLALGEAEGWRSPGVSQLTMGLRVFGWVVAIGLPLLVAIVFRRKAAWPNVIAVLWVLALIGLNQVTGNLALYAWWAIGAIALVAWGVSDERPERINMGAAIFAATVVTFYFSTVMDKLGRSASLVGFGLLFLAGGWALERVRRRLISQVRGQA
jgi:uncharacterized membrane protein